MSEPIRNYSKLARDIIAAVGGEKNITNVSRCTTRLRLVLNETPNDAKEKISSMPGVITVVERGGQFQIVIGTHVGEVFDTVSKELNLDTKQSGAAEVKESLLNRIIATMSAVFAPFVYILASAGLIQGCLIIITQFAPDFAKTGTYEVISFMSWTPFTFLPIFIAITASKHFKCNTYIAIVCCCALVNPSWNDMASRIANGETIKFLIFSLSETTYTSSVLPPLFLVLILSYLERFCYKILPDVIKPLATPFICLLIMVPATIVVIGPVSDKLASAIAAGYNFIYYSVPALAALVIGGFWQVVVIFGVHWGITPVILADFANNGSNSFQAFQTCAVVAQAAAAFGVFLKSRNKDFKRVAFSAGLTGVFGITEPAIYGVTLRLKKPFICGCIAGALGAVVTSFFGSMYYIYSGLPGVLTIVNAISPKNPSSFIGEVVGCAIAIIGSIVLVQIVGFEDPVNSDISDK
ncbi:PTS transporter subunit EIIC [Brachyspira hampsonii]|uniref:PTS transporter subunit EIIC n=1 Tax=Brachyspira hampsonii TaxID=1287055 RepID=UPI000D3C0558|nr:PTS transporter subunit EIIC [Brachyspira hampsonii]PTY39256.1 PTS trehalose transporter subunit IIBC [Brachyspira hampsonii bv. II]